MQVQISTIASNSDFKVNLESCEAFISQRKTAEITGVPAATIRDWLKADREKSDDQECPRTYNVNENNQLDAKSLQKLVLSAHLKGYEKCADLMEKLMEAGATAFICHMAGVTLQPKVDPTLPQTRIEAVRAYLVTLEQLEVAEQLAAQQAIVVSQQSGLLVQQKEVIDYKKIITGEGEEYFPISLILNHNEDRTFSGRRLAIFSAKAEIDPIPMFASKGQIPVKAYHWSVWEAAYPNVVLPE